MREHFATNLNLRAMMASESPDIKPVVPIARVGDEFHCRICSTVVALELVDEHSKLCVEAHQHQYESLCATERLQEATDEIAAQILNHGFEVRDPNFHPIVFPCLYIYLLADVAVNVRPTEPDAHGRLETIRGAMNFFKPPPGQSSAIFGRLLAILEEKMRAVCQVSEAFHQWKATTQDGAGSLSGYDITLSGFEFIRPISSGAFARIYLARKKATQDIVAVKVIQRSLVNYKNQLPKVVLERDILLKLNSPFTVRFCMISARWHSSGVPELTHRLFVLGRQ
jgi:hypothetical protein